MGRQHRTEFDVNNNFNPEDGSDILLRNLGNVLPDYMPSLERNRHLAVLSVGLCYEVNFIAGCSFVSLKINVSLSTNMTAYRPHATHCIHIAARLCCPHIARDIQCSVSGTFIELPAGNTYPCELS
jgi:hypothetical protein